MTIQRSFPRFGAAALLAASACVVVAAAGRQAPAQFGGAYAGLGERRQHLVNDWVARFSKVSGVTLDPGAFYDDSIKFSMKTTFDAVTHALMTTPLSDESGRPLGDALDLIERIDTVRGHSPGAPGDRQFRIYVTLKDGARARLEQSKQFKRGPDNTVYHKGFPISFRAQGGPPSIQVSMTLDGRRADIDVDYRSSSFPAALFNGHLTAANSDVRAGNNFDRHTARWSGFVNWWRSFFGIRVEQAPADVQKDRSLSLPTAPRAGKAPIEVMVNDFLKAWLDEGDIVASMGYVSDRAYACIEEESDPSNYDRGMAPFQLMNGLKLAHQALKKQAPATGASVGVRLNVPGLQVVSQPYHARFVLYGVPDDIAARFDCANRLTPGVAKTPQRKYGTYYGATFYVPGATRPSVALLWAQERGYWKVVSWQGDADEGDEPMPADAAPEVEIVRISSDPTLVRAARGFLESWLIRKDYDRAFGYLAPEAYGCYNMSRGPESPAAATPAEAGRLLRAAIERAGNAVAKIRNLDQLVAAAEPIHPAVRMMEHPHSRTFTLVSYPDVAGQAAGCSARVDASTFAGSAPLEYGKVFGMNVRFRIEAGEGPIMRTLWEKDARGWRITMYHVEYP